MIKILIFDAILWTVGYFALFVGNFYAANLLSFLIFVLFISVLSLFIIFKLYSFIRHTDQLEPDDRVKVNTFLSKLKQNPLSSFGRGYIIVTSATEFAILISFGWTFCGIAWMLITFMAMDIRRGAKEDIL